MDTIIRNIQTHILRFRAEYTVFFSVSAIASIFTAYLYNLGLVKTLVDQNSHLNIARQVTDSITPGISQIGFWPPLLHMLMVPASTIDSLFHSGLSGAVTLIPILGIASVMLFKLIRLFIPSNGLAALGVAFFVSNPYILYYATTPMTEILFITTLIGTAYFTVLWIKNDRIFDLVFTGLMIFAASIARYEGFFLLPVVGAVVLITLMRRRKRYQEIEAVFILFGVIAVLGLAFTLVYGVAFAGDPLAFMNNVWSADAQQQDYFLPTKKQKIT